MSNNNTSIGVLVCTCQRPHMLKQCLEGLIQQEQETGWNLEICVIDNDRTPTAASVVSELQSNSPVPIEFVHEAQRGIPFARNRSLMQAVDRRWNWVAMIDDDEVPQSDWLQQHLKSVISFNADISYGAVLKQYESEPPTWWPKDLPSSDPAGTELRRASTNNVLFSARLISTDGSALRFDHALVNGYEDLDFFERATTRGYKTVWTPDAVVTEFVPASRVEPDRLIAMVKSHADAHARVAVRRVGLPRAAVKFATKSFRRILGGSLLSGFFYACQKVGFSGAKPHYYKARLRLARGLGNFKGLTAPSGGYYDTIDGF